MPWTEALALIRSAHNIRLDNAYVPLREREGAKTYDQRIESLPAGKRKTFDEANAKRAESLSFDTQFHSEMRRLG